jgi:hypothetical protein
MAASGRIGDAAPPNWKECRLFTAYWQRSDWNTADLPPAYDLWNRKDLFRLADKRAMTLRNMTLEHCDVQLIGTATDGPEPRQVPFPHVAFLSPVIPRKFGIEDRLEAAMRRVWGRSYIDPYKECRVRFLQAPGQYSPRVLWGDGIFLPAERQMPQGRVEVSPWSDDEKEWGNWRPLCFGGGDVPAGLYRGQSGLVFSNIIGTTLAIDRRIGPTPTVFHLGASKLRPGPITLKPVASDGTTDGADDPWRVRKAGDEAGWDGWLRVWHNTTPLFQLRYALDNRKSRLHRAPPKADGFAIIGIVAPRHGGLARWWINLDDSGYLIASAMTDPNVTVVCDRGVVDRYVWETGRRRQEGDQLVEMIVGGERRQVLRFARPAGYVELPQIPATVSFGAGAPPDRFQLDWLDFSGAAEWFVGDRRTGLAELQGMAPVAPLAEPMARESQQGGAGAGAPFGTRLLLGPLLLESLSSS